MSAARKLDRRLARLRLAARSVLCLRALAAALGVGFAGFSLASVAVGRSAGDAAVASSWLLIGLSGLGALWIAARPLRGLSGAGAARLLAPRHPRLAMRVRSAAELSQLPAGASPSLVDAHLEATWHGLRNVRTGSVLPLKSLLRWDLLSSLLAASLGLGLMLSAERATQGTFTLLHPGAHSTDGVSLGVVFQSLELRVAYPHYMHRQPETLNAGDALELPPGSSVRVLAQGSSELREARMHTPQSALALQAKGEGRFEGRFVVRRAGVLSIRASEGDGVWIEDARRTRLELRADHPPQLSFSAPEEGAVVAGDELTVAFEARDDVGLDRVELCVSGPSRDVERELLWRHGQDLAGDGRHVEGEHALSLRALHAQRGDVLTLWLEAWDADDVSGPHQVRSETRHVTLESSHSERQEVIASLEQLRTSLTHHLADRLEVAEGETGATDLAGRLADLADQLSRAPSPSATTASLLHALGGHLASLARSEDGARGERAQLRAEARSRAGVERDLLSLDDLLTEARLADASELARELLALQREMVSLVAQLRSAPDEQTRRALETALGRVRSRLEELSARLAGRMGAGSGEFLNHGEAKTGPSEDALAAFERALREGDLDAMDRGLMRLEARIDALARALGGAQEGFAAERFGPRQAALAEAMDRLSGLEAEQSSISAAADRVRRDAAERALRGSLQGQLRPGLLEKARRAREALAQIPRAGMAASERRGVERALAQLRDTEDALRAGDLAQAREQSRATRGSGEALARDLELSELMGGGAAATARADAGRAAELRLGELATAIDRAIPNLRHHLDDAMRERLSRNATRQTRAEEAAGTLSELFGQSPDGRPLSTRGQAEVDAARAEMRGAAQAFSRTDPIDAGERSARAAARLASLRRELEREQRSPSPSSGRRAEEHVRIHGRGEAGGGSERRRRAMHALRESAPPGYEEALRQYYEELLR